MFFGARISWSNPIHRRFVRSGYFRGRRQEYFSLSCTNCELKRSTRSAVFVKHHFVRPQMMFSCSLTKPQKVHEQLPEKQNPVTSPELSRESVHSEMIQVLTYKMEKMVLQGSRSYLPLPIHAANAQSIAEERWTDFDAISVIPSLHKQHYLYRPKSENKPEPSPVNWDSDLKTFKQSLHQENEHMKSLRLKKKLETKSAKQKKLSKTLDDKAIVSSSSLTTDSDSAVNVLSETIRNNVVNSASSLSQENTCMLMKEGEFSMGEDLTSVNNCVKTDSEISVDLTLSSSIKPSLGENSVINQSHYQTTDLNEIAMENGTMDNSFHIDTSKLPGISLQDSAEEICDSSQRMPPLNAATAEPGLSSVKPNLESRNLSLKESLDSHAESDNRNVLLDGNFEKQISQLTTESPIPEQQISQLTTESPIPEQQISQLTTESPIPEQQISQLTRESPIPEQQISQLTTESPIPEQQISQLTRESPIPEQQISQLTTESPIPEQQISQLTTESPIPQPSLTLYSGDISHASIDMTSTSFDLDLSGSTQVAEEEIDNLSVKLAPPVFMTKKKKEKVEREKVKKQKGVSSKAQKKVASLSPYEIEKKISHFNQDLLAYVDTCIKADMVPSAKSTINYYRYNGNRSKDKMVDNKNVDTSFLKIRSVDIYNVLMHAWAKQGKLDEIKQCFSHMSEDGIKPTLQSYAACLECIARQTDPDITVTQRIIQDAEKSGFDIREIFNQCVFVKDEQQMVYKAIKDADPSYKPVGLSDSFSYNNPLLDELTTSVDNQQVVEKNPYHGVMAADQLQRRAEYQMELEVDFDAKVRSVISTPEPSEKCLKMREILEVTETEWRNMIKKGFERKIRYMQRKNKGDHGMTLYPYLKLFDLDNYVDLIMKEIHILAKESESFSPTSSYLWKRLGTRIHQKSIIQHKVKNKITKKMLNIYKTYSIHYDNAELGAGNHRNCWQRLCAQSMEGPTLDQPDPSWPFHIVKGLGKLLYDIILYDVKFDANILKSTEERRKIPSFYTVYRNYGHTTKEEIKPHPTLVKIYQGSEIEDLNFETRELPMLVPALPWVSAQSGGYLLSSAPLVRLPEQAYGQKQMMLKTPPEKLYPVLDSLNTLSACAWKINKPMLDLIISVFNNKGNKDLDIPPPVSEAPPVPKLSKSMTPQERSKVYSERLKVKQQRSEMYSLWCNELYRLSIANKFRDEVFWFPHNLDFRGRTYPCPPHFNHLGSDVVRSILYFAKGKPLGEKGLDWLKIHLVNLTGFKKRSPNLERLEYADSMMQSILDSADKPLTGEKWWQSSDEPWQTLACCMEIAQAVRSPDHTQFVSHFPVHQDGSCNGLQHYAALGRDQSGAESVNLVPFSEPKDVYSDVAVLVEKERAKDAEDGSEVAKALEGFVRRKVIKQTVMTTVYGVTRYGAKYQILRQLKDILEFPQEFVWAASLYLTEKTFHSLQEMFSATKEIQDWLTVSAHLISTVCSKPVEWITPLGFPIVQPYHKPIVSNRQGVRVFDSTNMFEKPNAMKQKNAFPPNFIHSLDSTHMMLTSLYCLRAGITYVSVHDCFWTHPSDVETMNKITREQFVALHEQPILEDLSRHLVEKFITTDKGNNSTLPLNSDPDSLEYLHTVLSRIPKKGDFDLKSILKSTYFFS